VGELADPYTDPVLAAFDLAFYEGEELVRRWVCTVIGVTPDQGSST
jgi:hypothetical protein